MSAEAPPAVPTVVIVGLGPAGSELMTVQARDALDDAPFVLVRTSQHPAAEPLLAEGAVSLDEHYVDEDTFEQTYDAIVEAVVEAAMRHGRVTYAVPGSPFVLEHTVELFRDDDRVRTEIIGGMSFLDIAWERLEIDPISARVRLVHAESFAVHAAGDTGPMLIAHAWSRRILSEVKLSVEHSPATPVIFLHHLGLADEVIVSCPWDDLDRSIEPDHLTCVYVPSLAPPVAAELVSAIEVITRLRSECPWDKEQTHQSLVRHLLEETYEAIEAIEQLSETPTASEIDHLEEELGDVLCQVLFHATIASEEGFFNLADVAQHLTDKLVRRHPHVFGDVAGLHDAAAVLSQWEQIKQVEKGRESLLDGIPPALPALALATKLERKLATVDLGWTSGTNGLDIATMFANIANGETDAMGELLLELARYSAHLGIDPEEALRRASGRLRDRFTAAEKAAEAAGTTLKAMTPDERIALFAAGGSA